MATIKEYNIKLKSLNNTQKITRTMKMVAASKLRKAQQAQVNAKLYAQNLTALISRISKMVDSSHHPLLVEHNETKNALILVFTSDKGLCGAFNHNAHRHVNQWLEQYKDQYGRVDLSFCGHRGFQFFKKLENVKQHYENVTGMPTFLNAENIGKDIERDFRAGEYHEVYLAYNQFLSPLSQKTIFEKILTVMRSSSDNSSMPKIAIIS